MYIIWNTGLVDLSVVFSINIKYFLVQINNKFHFVFLMYLFIILCLVGCLTRLTQLAAIGTLSVTVNFD